MSPHHPDPDRYDWLSPSPEEAIRNRRRRFGQVLFGLFIAWLLTAAALYACSPMARADTFTGRASVIDGNTIEIQDQRIRLHGIDAPESSQTCRGRWGFPYRCGQRAALALSELIGSRPASCEQTDTDRYHRVVAICRLNGEDLNRWMVQQGHALAYRQYGTDYVADEDAAREAKRGMWVGSFVPPWDWRRGER